MSPRDDAGFADRRPHAVVIGAGFGGLAAAVRLGVRGCRVTLLDRLDAPGGRATARHDGGWRFDLGPTIVTAPHLFDELWTLAGRRMAEDVRLVPLDPFYEIRFDDGARFRAFADTQAARAEVRRLAPADLAGYDRFMAEAAAIFRTGFEELGTAPFGTLSDMLRAVPGLARIRADRSVHGHVAARVRDPHLRAALSFHPLFIGGNPFRVTAVYSLVAYLERRWGVHTCIGGAAALAEGLARLVRHTGGTLRLGAEADEILVRNGRAAGVRLVSGETLPADIVVSNADAVHTYRRLLRRALRRRWSDNRLDRLHSSMSLFVWHFGTRGTAGRWPDVGHHTILMGPRYRGLVDDIFGGRLAPDMSLYLHRPSVTDPTAAPPGGDAFYVLSPVPHLGHGHGQGPGQGWSDPEPYRRAVAARLEATLPGFAETIETSHLMTPPDFRDRYLSPLGAGFSIEPRLLQSAWFRPHNRSEELAGLYLVGAGTHPGAGLPGVLSSAAILDRIVDVPSLA